MENIIESILYIGIPGLILTVLFIGAFTKPGISTTPGEGLTSPAPGEPYGRWNPKPGELNEQE